ncbi:MAG: lipopolysaccharide assembly protein LapA domain-containing protein [Anaerolineales bacterium]|jgi:putative membrane protein
MQIFLFIALLIMLVAIIFAVQNTEPTQVQFLAWKTEGSLALVLLLTLLAGVLISYFFSLPSKLRDKLTIRSQSKKITQLEDSLKEKQSQLEETQGKLEETDSETLGANEIYAESDA